MAILITRTAVVPVWLLACALVVVLVSPSSMVATGLLLLSSGLAAAAILLLGKNAAQPSVSEQRWPWPKSGFRNIGRGTKGG
jgi:hypothetical protein